MVAVADAIGLVVIVLANTGIAALLTRFFRVRMTTAWAGPLYAVGLGSFAMLVSTLLLGGFLSLGPNLQSHGLVVGVTIVTPLVIGMTVDYLWMPAPEEIELPDRYEETPPESR